MPTISSFPPCPLLPELLMSIFDDYQSTCSGSALISLICLSRELYQQHVHRLYRTVNLHMGNAHLFYREILEPFELDVMEHEEQWKRLAGKGGREQGTRLGPHVFRPGQSLLNKICLCWEVDHISMLDLAAIDNADAAGGRLQLLANHVYKVLGTATQAQTQRSRLYIFHCEVYLSLTWASIQPLCTDPEGFSPRTHMSRGAFGYAWANRPYVCLDLPPVGETCALSVPDLYTVLETILSISRVFTLHNCPPIDLSSYPASADFHPERRLASVAFNAAYAPIYLVPDLESMVTECVQKAVQGHRVKGSSPEGHRFEFERFSEVTVSRLEGLLRLQEQRVKCYQATKA
ncbi:hypothetical protein L198_00052 [Cryptococcus wingfieldii CBS 7118]|uniref:Uncharacterized protein n=1 Tax=Cryptococcus wingfieldii CBS 7118 TaxID=1295528 RepID=A0A1E3K549_9TREE|nr:hypothetical protein L198_00052 [Cryptococcus wingfieldii CBS 7118]ODO08328.1 hypothetical protein L198_00052 [Cryptococcus wingfieldii CBS 7118]